jgi:hypothetical protein
MRLRSHSVASTRTHKPMSDERTLASFQNEVVGLALRLNSRMREFEQDGEFSQIHQELVMRLRERQEQLRKKVEIAVAQGTAWDIVKAELARDFAAIFDSLLLFEEHLEASAMKKRRA